MRMLSAMELFYDERDDAAHATLKRIRVGARKGSEVITGG
jgi:hypothetical protein